MLGRIIRRNIFWLLDYFKGSPIDNHYKDIKEIFENKNNEKSRIEDYLHKLLIHSTETVEFYKPYSSFLSLHDLPIINKQMIKENPKRFISSKYANEKLHSMRTSGSTGSPFVFLQDMNKRNRVLASLIYFGELCGYKVGMRNIYLGVWAEDDKKSRWDKYKKNMIVEDIISLGDEQLEKIRKKLKSDRRLRYMLGYASSLDKLSQYLLSKGDNQSMFHLDIIVSTAESLSESTRKDLKKVFGCNIISRYANTENGILAQECTSKLEFHMNTADYIFEILKMESDELVEVGEMGRIVITDLFNYAMPLIRYDTGDIGVISEKTKCDWNTSVFERIDGRLIDILYDTEGNPISPLWDFDMDQFEKLIQYQFIQEGLKTYKLNVNGAREAYPDELLIGQMKKTLGDDAIITVNHINDIPALSSGKFKQSINNYYRE